jgi:hypothetical protein
VPRSVAILAAVAVLVASPISTSRVAVASIPSPREEGDTKSGKMTPAEDLPPETRVVQLPKGRAYPEHLKYGTSWQEPVLCGPNSLYVLLRLCDIQADRERVMKLVPVTPSGSTLADLSRAATALGLSHEVRKVSQSELFRLPPPFLVHEDVRSSDAEVKDSGHFFVIVRFKDNGQIGVIDGVSGVYQFVEAARFDRSFSGYVLLPRVKFLGIPTRWVWSVIYVLAASVAILSCALVYLNRPVAARRDPAGNPA